MTDLEELLREAAGPTEHRVEVQDVLGRSVAIRHRRSMLQAGATLTVLVVAAGWLLTSTLGDGRATTSAEAIAAPASAEGAATPSTTALSIEPAPTGDGAATQPLSVDPTDPATTIQPTEQDQQPPSSPADAPAADRTDSDSTESGDPESDTAGSDPTTAPKPADTSTSAPADPRAEPATPSGTGFELLATDSIPASLQRGNLTSPTMVRVFPEADRTVLTAPLVVDGFIEGRRFNGDSERTTTLPSGSAVCVWFVHGDIGDAGYLQATIDFKEPILGLALHAETTLTATNQFAVRGIVYVYDGAGDTDRFTVNGSVLELRLQQAATGKDQFRVLTKC